MSSTLRPHPLNVQPYGSSLCASAARCRRAAGLGQWARLDDEAVLTAMSWADARSLAALCVCSGATYAYANSESLWRALALRPGATVSAWHGGSWRTRQGLAPAATRLTGVYSDALFHRWRVRCFGLPRAAQDRNTVDRHNGRRNDPSRLSVDAFRAQYESGDGTPVVLTGACAHWPAQARAQSAWHRRQLRPVQLPRQLVSQR